MSVPVTYPHEALPSGPAATFAAEIVAMLPRLETARLVLRAPTMADFEAYRAILMSDRAVHMNGPLDRRDAWLDFAQCVANWQLRGHGLFVITAKDNGETLGFTLVCLEYGDREPELGWFLLADAEGRGVAFEAAEAVKAHALDQLRLDSLVSYIDEDNTRSVRLAERLGARLDPVATAELGEAGAGVWRHWPLDGDGGMEAYA